MRMQLRGWVKGPHRYTCALGRVTRRLARAPHRTQGKRGRWISPSAAQPGGTGPGLSWQGPQLRCREGRLGGTCAICLWALQLFPTCNQICDLQSPFSPHHPQKLRPWERTKVPQPQSADSYLPKPPSADPYHLPNRCPQTQHPSPAPQTLTSPRPSKSADPKSQTPPSPPHPKSAVARGTEQGLKQGMTLPHHVPGLALSHSRKTYKHPGGWEPSCRSPAPAGIPPSSPSPRPHRPGLPLRTAHRSPPDAPPCTAKFLIESFLPTCYTL